MSEASHTIHPRQSTLFGTIFAILGRIIGVLLISMMLSIVIEWLMMAFLDIHVSGEPEHYHAKRMFQYEVQFINEFLSQSHLSGTQLTVIERAQAGMVAVINLLFVDSGIVEYFKLLGVPQQNEWRITRYFKNLLLQFQEYFLAALYVMMLFLVRLTILILSIPIFVLFGIVGLSDGLMQRDLRRWRAGNESSYMYHYAKKFALPVVFTGMVLYLSSPYSIHPNLIILPTAVAFAGLVMLMASKFKKYL